jgi:hypothetical protein
LSEVLRWVVAKDEAAAVEVETDAEVVCYCQVYFFEEGKSEA